MVTGEACQEMGGPSYSGMTHMGLGVCLCLPTEWLKGAVYAGSRVVERLVLHASQKLRSRLGELALQTFRHNQPAVFVLDRATHLTGPNTVPD